MWLWIRQFIRLMTRLAFRLLTRFILRQQMECQSASTNEWSLIMIPTYVIEKDWLKDWSLYETSLHRQTVSIDIMIKTQTYMSVWVFTAIIIKFMTFPFLPFLQQEGSGAGEKGCGRWLCSPGPATDGLPQRSQHHRGTLVCGCWHTHTYLSGIICFERNLMSCIDTGRQADT